MKSQEVEARIIARFPGADVVLRGEDCSFSVEITAAEFASLSLLERQRSVLALFTEEFQSGALHAMSIVARVPDGTGSSELGLQGGAS